MLVLAAQRSVAAIRLGTAEKLPLVLGTTAGGMSLGEDYFRQAVQHAASASPPAHPGGSLSAASPGADGARRARFQRADHHHLQRLRLRRTCAIGHAWDLIRGGQAERVVAGGYDALEPIGFFRLRLAAGAFADLCRPFDAHRDGLALGEGAAMLTLETLESARRRGAEILGELIGYGTAIDRHHLTQPHPQGGTTFAAMKQACAMRGVTPEEIDYINAHGTGTVLNDSSEALAISRMGRRAAPRRLPVSSTKASIGHLLGGAGAVEAVICLMTLREQWLPPEIDFETPDPACKFPIVTQPQDARVNIGAFQLVRLRRRQCHLDFAEVGMSRIFVSGCGAVSPAGWNVGGTARRAGRKDKPLPIQPLDRPGWEKPLRQRVGADPASAPGISGASAPAPHQSDHALRRRRRARSRCQICAPNPAAQDRSASSSVCNPAACNTPAVFIDETLKNPATASPLRVSRNGLCRAGQPSSPRCWKMCRSPARSSAIRRAFAQGVALGAHWLEENRVDACLVIGAEETNWMRADALWHLEPRHHQRPARARCACAATHEISIGVELAAITDAANLFRPQKPRASRAGHARATPPDGKFPANCSATVWATARARTRRNSPRGNNWTGARVSPKKILGEGLMAAAAWQCVAACDAVAGKNFHRPLSVSSAPTSRRWESVFRLAPARTCRPSFEIQIMDATTELKLEIKQLLVENLMLQISAEEIGDDQPLFGPGSVGLDSVDALQIVVALDKKYGLKIQDAEAAKQILRSVHTIAEAVVQHRANPVAAK